jgi:hypothetical protein
VSLPTQQQQIEEICAGYGHVISQSHRNSAGITSEMKRNPAAS